MSIYEQSAVELLAGLNSGELTSVEITRSYLDRIEKHESSINAFISVAAEEAVSQAEAIDARRAKGESIGPLGGLPVAVKDNICVKDHRTTCGSKMLENYRPPYDATVVDKLIASDAVIIGKTNLDEFAMGSSTEASYFPATRNPWDTDRVPGGSSGGSAAAVAAGFAPISLGSDTGGSIRQPASLCGVVGVKPTYGRVSRYGLVAFASSLDQIGPFAGSVSDAALLLDAIAGHDPRDSTSANVPAESILAGLDEPLTNLKLGVVKEHFGEGLDEEVAAAVKEAIGVYESLGAEVREVSLPHSPYGIAAYYIIAPSEASSNLARYDGAHYGYRTDEKAMLAELKAEIRDAEQNGQDPDEIDSPLVRMYRKSRAEGFGPEVKRRIMLGTYALSEGYSDKYYNQALKARRLIRNDYDAAFADVDFLIGPVAPTPAYKIGEKTDDPLSMYLDDLYTVGANLAGIPGVSLPCGMTGSGLPIGLQIQGQAMQESRLLRAARMFESATSHHQNRPQL